VSQHAPPALGRSRAILLAAAALLSQGCFASSYLAQAAGGELGILRAARSNREVTRDSDAPGRMRRLVASVRSIKAFGEAQGLRATRNYRRYAELRRPAAVWVVEACAPLAFEVRHWSFPLVGSIPYLGFFGEPAARSYAAKLEREEGLDVDVRGAGAFSTLGWFEDPVLSTMISSGDEALGDLANVVLHESVHATLYVRDQSGFNESLASFVADGLTEPWLTSVLGRDAPETRAWVAAHARRRARAGRLHQGYQELAALYGSGAEDARKLSEKARILESLRAELSLARPLNNAVLADFKAYDSGGPAFGRLLAACDGRWHRFLRAVAGLGEASFTRRQQQDLEPVVDRLLAQGCR
jgi:predicted aminopeptidase